MCMTSSKTLQKDNRVARVCVRARVLSPHIRILVHGSGAASRSLPQRTVLDAGRGPRAASFTLYSGSGPGCNAFKGGAWLSSRFVRGTKSEVWRLELLEDLFPLRNPKHGYKMNLRQS